MKRLLPAITLVCLLSAPVIADGGETSGPGKTTPPPCTMNCTQTTTADTDLGETDWILLLIIAIATKP